MNFELDESDEDDSDVIFSDEEDFEQNPALLQSLRSGILPIDLRAMYSLCLVGVGGKDYVALNYLENVIFSNELVSFDEDNKITSDDGIGTDSEWITFKRNLTSPVSKTSILAYVADLVKNVTKERYWFHRVFRIFRSHLKVIDSEQGLDEVVSSPNELLRSNTLKILFAATKMMVDCARVTMASLSETDKNEAETIHGVMTDAVYTLKIIMRFQHIMWNPKLSDWSLPPKSIDVSMRSLEMS